MTSLVTVLLVKRLVTQPPHQLKTLLNNKQ